MSVMDNRCFGVRGRGENELAATLELAFQVLDIRTIVGTRLSRSRGLVLYKHASSQMASLPFPVGLDSVIALAKEYLGCEMSKSVELGILGEDCDRTLADAWRVYCEEWGHVEADPAACLAVKYEIAMLGK